MATNWKKHEATILREYTRDDIVVGEVAIVVRGAVSDRGAVSLHTATSEDPDHADLYDTLTDAEHDRSCTALLAAAGFGRLVVRMEDIGLIASTLGNHRGTEDENRRALALVAQLAGIAAEIGRRRAPKPDDTAPALDADDSGEQARHDALRDEQ